MEGLSQELVGCEKGKPFETSVMLLWEEKTLLSLTFFLLVCSLFCLFLSSLRLLFGSWEEFNSVFYIYWYLFDPFILSVSLNYFGDNRVIFLEYSCRQ